MRAPFSILLLGVIFCASLAAQSAMEPPSGSSYEGYVGETFPSLQFQVVNPPAGFTAGPFYVGAGTLPPGLTLSPSGLLAGVPTTPGFYTVTILRDYFLISASVTITVSGTYYFSIDNRLVFLTPTPLPPATAGVPVTRTIQTNLPAGWDAGPSTLPSGVTLDFPTEVGTTVTLTGVFPPVSVPATYTVLLYASSGLYLEQTIQRTYSITVNPAPQLSSSLPDGQVGSPYSGLLSVSGGTGPFSFALVGGSLPPGLVLGSSTGVVSGTPSARGTFNFTVVATDANGAQASAPLSITVRPEPLLILTGLLPVGATGPSYSAQLEAVGGVPPYDWTVAAGALPPGLTLGAATGLLSGTPAAAGTFEFTAQVRDSVQATATRSYTLRISEPLLITTTSLPEGTEGETYSASIAASGGFPPYAFSLAGGSLPPGLSLSSGGAISGTPSESGAFSFTVQVRDNEGQTAQRAFTLTVFLRPAITTASLPDGRVADPYSATLEVTGRAPFQWSIASGSLPPGLSLDPATGTISGTPTLHGTYTFTATVSDGNQPPLSASREFAIRIELPPLPPLAITQIQETVPPASQPSFGLQLAQPFPAELTGTATIEFTPDPGLPDDPAIRFASGGRSVNFTIPAGQAAAVPASGSLFALQTGTTAGTITIRVTLRLGQAVLSPDPFSTRVVRIPPAGPQITRLVIVRTPAGFEVQVTGFTNTRQITGATFRFTPAPGASIGTAEVSVPVASAFQSWFASSDSQQFGGQFTLVVPFTLQGSAGALASLQVTLTNSAGSGSATANF